MNMIDPSRSHPEYLFQLIDIKLIDIKDHFIDRLYDGPVDVQVFNTLQKFGQLKPLLVQQQTDSRYHLLSGYSDFSALKKLAINTIACQILPHTTPYLTLFSLQILHIFCLPHPSPILQAHLLYNAQRLLPEEELLQLLSLMGYKPQRYKLEELLSYLQLDPSAISALHCGILSQKSAKQLALLSHEDQSLLVNLITTYRLGGSKQQKLVERVIELALRNNSAVATIINEYLPVLEGASNNLPQQVQGLMQYLYEQCNPDKTAAEKDFKNLVQELQPWKEVTIEHSLSFEDESLEIRLRFADAGKLRGSWEKIKMVVT